MKTDLRNTAVFMIGSLAVGHSVFHWIIQSFVVLLPEIQQTFGLSAIAIGGLLASREMASGIKRFPYDNRVPDKKSRKIFRLRRGVLFPPSETL